MCDTVVVVHPDRVLFAKASDRDPNEAQVLDWQPARSHAPGEVLRCTWIEIPQAERTHAVLLSRPFWMWGAEMGANEHGVVIGNEAVYTDQPEAETGLTGMDLVRLALERATTAQQAVEVISELLAAHGQGGGTSLEKPKDTYHNSFLCADPVAAWVLETAGALTAVEQVHGARSISNGLTIPGFAERHGRRLEQWGGDCRRRRALTEGRACGPDGTGPAGLAAILRDHGGPEPHYSWVNGTLRAPCNHGGGIGVGTVTTGAWVAELRSGACRHWATATAGTCLSLFKPVRLDAPLDLGRPTDKADDTLWWRHERLHRAVLRDYRSLAPLVQSERDEIEAGWWAEPPEPAAAFARGEALLEAASERVRAAATGADGRPLWARRYWRLRNERAGL